MNIILYSCASLCQFVYTEIVQCVSEWYALVKNFMYKITGKYTPVMVWVLIMASHAMWKTRKGPRDIDKNRHCVCVWFLYNDDAMTVTWKHSPHYWPLVSETGRVSFAKGQICKIVRFSLFIAPNKLLNTRAIGRPFETLMTYTPRVNSQYIWHDLFC